MAPTHPLQMSSPVCKCNLFLLYVYHLFLLYINDITDSINSNIRLFADDSILYREIQTPKDHDILQTDLNKLSEWATKWQINFNIAKCHLLRITKKRKPSHFTYTITNQPIFQVESHPYLGITIDSKLSWSTHIHSTTSQCARTRPPKMHSPPCNT